MRSLTAHEAHTFRRRLRYSRRQSSPPGLTLNPEPRYATAERVEGGGRCHSRVRTDSASETKKYLWGQSTTNSPRPEDPPALPSTPPTPWVATAQGSTPYPPTPQKMKAPYPTPHMNEVQLRAVVFISAPPLFEIGLRVLF